MTEKAVTRVTRWETQCCGFCFNVPAPSVEHDLEYPQPKYEPEKDRHYGQGRCPGCRSERPILRRVTE